MVNGLNPGLVYIYIVLDFKVTMSEKLFTGFTSSNAATTYNTA